eukprot:2311002-Rhodomonas_salina.1
MTLRSRDRLSLFAGGRRHCLGAFVTLAELLTHDHDHAAPGDFVTLHCVRARPVALTQSLGLSSSWRHPCPRSSNFRLPGRVTGRPPLPAWQCPCSTEPGLGTSDSGSFFKVWCSQKPDRHGRRGGGSSHSLGGGKCGQVLVSECSLSPG